MKYPRPLRSLSVALLAAGLGLAAVAAPAPAHTLYLCASINSSSRVMGGGNAARDGLYVRTATGSFEHQGLNMPLLITAVPDPQQPAHLYVAGLSGAMRTTDGGKSWRILTGWDETEPKSLAFDAQNPARLYVGLPDGFIVSDDRGATWRRAEQGLPARGKYTQCLQVDRTRGGRVLIGCETGIYLTEDGAQSWRRVLETVDTVNDLQQSPHDPRHWLAVSQSAGVLESRDGGLSWRRLPGLPLEKAWYNIVFDPKNRGRLAVASWSYGLLTSEDDGQSWTPRNAGLPGEGTPRVWRTAFDPDDGRLYAAVVEKALYASADFGRTWQPIGMEGSIIRSFTFVPTAR